VSFDWRFLLTPRLAEAIAAGVAETLVIALCATAGAFALGALLALLRAGGGRWAGRSAAAYVVFFRNVPVLIQMFFWYFGLPNLLPPIDFPQFYAGHFEAGVAVLAISLTMGAFVAEVLRAGIEAVPHGQLEAAFSLGLRRWRAYRLIVVPQLVPIVLPGLASETINVVKSTAFAMAIGVSELMWQAQKIEAETFRGFEIMTAVTVVYFLLSSAIVLGFRALESAAGRSAGIA
jgi:polar amino acid transport system permease protein